MHLNLSLQTSARSAPLPAMNFSTYLADLIAPIANPLP